MSLDGDGIPDQCFVEVMVVKNKERKVDVGVVVAIGSLSWLF